jgi:hypothetical protein
MGLDLLRLSQNNNELVRSIVVLTDVIENLNKETYKNLLGQLAKPMKLVDLVNNIVSFHISKRNIKAVYGSNHVTIMNGIAARKPVINQTEEVLNDINGETIYYDDILCIKTGARDVVLYLRNRETRTFNTNILTMVKIENSTKPDENTPGNIRKINNRLAINLNATWTQRYVLQIGDSAYLPEFHRWLLDNNVQFEDLRISDAFKEIRAILPNYNQ